MPVRPDYDCLIIGGGMVGASLACALADQSLQIALIEAVPFQSDQQSSYDDRGLALAPSSQRILAGLGLWQPIAPEATPIHHIHVSDRGHFGFTRMEASQVGVPALGYVVIARTLGKALWSRLAAQDHVDLLCPANLKGVRFHPELVEVTLKQGEQSCTLTSRLLVAADGGASEVRRHLGIQTDVWDYQQTAVVANVTPERSHDNTAYERFTPSGPLALLPLGGQRCVVVWTVRTEESPALMALEDEIFLMGLTERFGRRLGRFVKVGRRHLYSLMLIRARKQIGLRYAIIGNAAHTIHPNAAQGLNLGLRDVAVLAEVLTRASRAGQDPGSQEVLTTYANLRRADHRRVISFSHVLARLFYNDLLPLIITRNLAMLALDIIPPLKRELMRRAMGIAGRQPRLIRGLSL